MTDATTLPVEDTTALVQSTDVVLDDSNTLTWADLSTVTTKKLYVPKYGKYLEYKSFLPLSKVAQIQAQYMGDRKDFEGYMIAVLSNVMVAPALNTPDAVRAAKQADSGVLLQIVTDVMGEKEAKSIAANTGNV